MDFVRCLPTIGFTDFSRQFEVTQAYQSAIMLSEGSILFPSTISPDIQLDRELKSVLFASQLYGKSSNFGNLNR
jgi:hypothetical protein